MKLKNKYYIMRHGQAISNVKSLCSCWPEKFYNPLTKKGLAQVKKTAKEFKNKKIDYIFASDILRTKQTAGIVGEKVSVKPRFDKRLREQNSGIFNGLPFQELREFFGPRSVSRLKLKPINGETYIDIQKRVVAFLKAIDKKYKGKNILIVSHELPLILLELAVRGIPNKYFYEKRIDMATAQLRELI